MNIQAFINAAIIEDIGCGDHTSLACVPNHNNSKAKLIAKEKGIIAGIQIALMVFKTIDQNLKVELFKKDGDSINPNDIILHVYGNPQSILKAERLTLNIMQRMSGIATYTHHLTSLIKHTNCKLLDTRKTSPNMRLMEKQAVVIGGGHNHRFGLYDMIILKDNHIDYAGGISNAINKTNDYLQKNNLMLNIEIETRSIAEVKEVLAIGKINRIMFDNFSINDVQIALSLIQNKFETEASGGITEINLREYANTGVNYISMGALTHSVKSLDLSLKAI